jgi:hypothetical protein
VTFSKEARLHEKVVQQIAQQSLPKVQGTHTTNTKEQHMAQRVSITLVDDLDGTEAAETVTFGLDGVNYEIDLSEQNAKELRSRFDDFIPSARKVGGKRKRGTGGVKSQSKVIREWARENGLEVPSRGVLPASVVAAYEAAH